MSLEIETKVKQAFPAAEAKRASEMDRRILTAKLAQSLEAGMAARVKQALEEGADPNGVSEEGKLMLTIAADFLGYSGKERLQCLRALLKAGALPSAKNNQGVSALAKVASRMRKITGDPHESALEALLAAGADPLAVSTTGWSALHRAAEGGSERMAKRLIKAGALINQTNDFSETALMLAATYNHSACVLALLSAGADPMALDCEGRNALTRCAERYGEDAESAGPLRCAMEAIELKGSLGVGQKKAAARL